MTRHVNIRQTAVAAVFLAIVGCSSTVTGADESAPFASWDGYEPDGLLWQAARSGTLIIEDGCLYGVGGNGRWLPVLPTETRWDEGSGELTLEGMTVRIGDKAHFVGGSFQDSSVADHIPDTCDLDSLREGDGFFRGAITRSPLEDK